MSAVRDIHQDMRATLLRPRSSRRFLEARERGRALVDVLELRARLTKHPERAEVHEVVHETGDRFLADGEHGGLGVNECRESFEFDLLLLDLSAKRRNVGFEIRLTTGQ